MQIVLMHQLLFETAIIGRLRAVAADNYLVSSIAKRFGSICSCFIGNSLILIDFV
jgi:hypothetical protein